MKQKVAVLRGGPSQQYTRSLESGAYILKNLPEKYEGRDVFIDKAGDWYVNGIKVKPQHALDHVQVVWNALHGEYGEDGKVQHLLENINMPYTGSDSIASALSMNKKLSKKSFADHSILTPSYIVVEKGDDLEGHARHIFFNFHMPVVIKPSTSGGSAGVGVARAKKDIVPLLEAALLISTAVIVEAYISGREVSSIVIEDMRGEKYYVPIPVEIRYPKNKDIFDKEIKHMKAAQDEYAFHFTDEIKAHISDVARKVHEALGLRHYSRTDMKITPNGKIYILEANTTPVLHHDAITIKSLEAVGVTLGAFIDHMLSLALKVK